MLYGMVNSAAQQVVAVGPRPGVGHEVSLRACVGLVPECEFGPYGSPERKQAEVDLLQAFAGWSKGEGAVRPTGVAGGGWTLECRWAGGKGTRRSLLDIRPVGGPSSAAMQQLRQWLADGCIRLPLPSDPTVTVLVPCMACPGELPLGQVQVTLRGLPSSLMLKDAVAVVLKAVGYDGSQSGGPKLRVMEVFRGWHADEPNLADGSLCAFVDQPEHDPELRRLPSTISLGHDHAVIEVLVSSRRATFVYGGAPVDGPTVGGAAGADTAAGGPTQPPPPPARPPQHQQPPPPSPAATPQRQAWRPAAPAAPRAPPTPNDEGVAAMDAQGPAGDAPAEGQATAATRAAGTVAAAAAPAPAAGDALDRACVDRPAMARQLTEWANNTFGHAASAAEVRRLLAEGVERSSVLRGQLLRLAALQGELNLEELPPEALVKELVTAFAKAGISTASYDAVDGVRRSARLQPSAASPRGRSLVRAERRPGSGRGRRQARSAGGGGGGGGGAGGREGRSRSRSQGGTSE